MINIKNALILVNRIHGLRQSTELKHEQLTELTPIDKALIESEVYVSLGDIRQAVIVYLEYKKQSDIVTAILDFIVSAGTFEDAGKLITSSDWGKDEANVKAAAMLCCQLSSNKPCKNLEGCNCGG